MFRRFLMCAIISTSSLCWQYYCFRCKRFTWNNCFNSNDLKVHQMAQSRRTIPKYVYDIPYFERMELCKILDQNDKWEELGGIYMNFDMLTIQTLRREILRGNSPTDELLTKWGHQNHTILELFVLLSKMQHYQAMSVLKPFVDTEYHRLIYEGEQNLCRLFGEKKNSKSIPFNCTDKKTAQALGMKENNNNPHHQNCSNNFDNISANLNFSKPQNNLQDKIAFIGTKDNQVKHSSGEKILNGLVVNNSDANADHSNQNRNNAQTVLITKENNVANKPKDQLKFLKPEFGKDKSTSEISSIAESFGILPVITFKEIEMATNGWDTSAILGKGGFGTVFKGTWKNTAVAIKRTRSSETNENHSVQIQQILGELKMLNSYRHDNILPLYGFSMDGEDPCLIYQYMPNGSLEDRLLCRHGTRPLTWYQRLNIATGTARGIQFLHTIGEKPLIHGDIKSANILLDSNFEAKIGDFGLAREGPYNHYTHMKVSRVHGTRPYLPDEFLRHKKFSTKVDTHSFGIVLFELATGLRAYDDQRQQKFLKELIENTQPSQLGSLMDKKCGPDEQTFLNLIELGKCCVQRKPKDRPEMVVVLQELNAMTIKRDMLVKIQSMIRQNNLIPSTPLEMQVLHDHLNQPKRISPECSKFNQIRLPTIALSPLQSPFYPESNAIAQAASLEAQAAFNANIVNNNPFLHVDLEKKAKDITGPVGCKEKNQGWVAQKELPKHTDAPGQSMNGQQTTQAKDLKIQTPTISVSPPSAFQSSSASSEEEDGIATNLSDNHNQEDLCYDYTSDIENFLPLISVLGVKGKSSEENKGNEEKPEPNIPNSGSGELATSAKGKLLWILDDTS